MQELSFILFKKISGFNEMVFKVNIVQWDARNLAPPTRWMYKLTFADVNAYVNNPPSSGN